jgi:hypothetical protein
MNIKKPTAEGAVAVPAGSINKWITRLVFLSIAVVCSRGQPSRECRCSGFQGAGAGFCA